MTLRKIKLLVLAIAALLAAAPSALADVAQLQRSFDQPPDNAKVLVRWWWFGPAVTQPQLEREMNHMKEGGFGGFEVQPTYPLALDDEKPGLKNLKFLSPEFFDALRFTAAKAKELGLRMNLTLGSGWPYGGPMFSIDEAAGRVRSISVKAAAGQGSVPAPKLNKGESLIAAYLGGQTGPNPYRELELRDGAAQLPGASDGSATVLFFVAGHTGMQVKRPAFGAEGYVIDHYSAPVVNKFIQDIAEPELKALGPNLPGSVFCDSLEVAGEDWTPDFLAEFQRRRGYDLRPWLPALSTDIGDKTRDIRLDWGRTITELFNENFTGTLQKWAQANHTLFRIQAYGTPPAALYSYAYADLPEGEGYNWKSLGMTRWASSASHLLGRPVTSSETWTWLHSPVFRATPLDMKAEADLHFLQGINQLIAHGWPYTPETIEYPGWRFYAAAVFNEKNPWWIVMPDVTAYLQRVSSLLRQGQPANDVALYLSNSDGWASFVPGRVAMNAALAQAAGPEIFRSILEAGYNYDCFDDGLLDLRGRVDGGTLAFGDLRYKVVILPGVERMPLKTLRQLEQFARAGGTVIATRRLPAVAPGFLATADDTRELNAIVQRLFKAPGAPGLFVENEGNLAAALASRLRPDIALSSPAPDVGFVHRHTDGGEVYFLANTANTPTGGAATFRVEGLQPEWWDPMTGRVTPAEIAGTPAGGTTVAYHLEPYGSQVLVFTPRRLPALAHSAAPAAMPAALDLSSGWTVAFGAGAKPVAMDQLQSWTENDATRFFSGVATYEKTSAVPAEMVSAGLGLELNFGESKPLAAGGRGALRPLPAPRNADQAAVAPAAGARGGRGARGAGGGGGTQRMQALLEAPVREAAVVYVNGTRAGSVWHPPYVLDVTGLLKSGDNVIRVDVANLALNYMAGHPLPDYTALTAKYGERFQAQDMAQVQPITSGLLGPIKLAAVVK
jgi:hypothetical protein